MFRGFSVTSGASVDITRRDDYGADSNFDGFAVLWDYRKHDCPFWSPYKEFKGGLEADPERILIKGNHSIIIIPLTLLSAWLLLSKPRVAKPAATAEND